MTRPETKPRTATRFGRLTVGVLVGLFALTACGSDGPAAGLLAADTATPGVNDAAAAPSDTAQTDPGPVTTDAPAPTPTRAPVTTTPAEAADDSSDTNWPLIIVVIIAGVALVLALVALFSRPKKQPATGRPAVAPTSPQQSPQVALLSTAQWIHDQLTLELMAAVPQQAVVRWANERSRLDNVAIGAQQQYAAGAGEPWQSLGQMMSLLATSLDTNLDLRAQDQSNAQLLAESTDVVNRHRATLQQLLTAMWPLARR